MLAHDGITYRRLDWAAGEQRAVVELQADIWAAEMVTPHHQLIAAEHVGGLVIGAFDADGCVGFSYGFPAHRDGSTWLHSHQTGVRDRHRDRGIGRVLKWLQRSLALVAGYRRVTWTFDPLQARNARVNLAVLGATAASYEVDYYGRLPGELNEGLATDRLFVDWELTSPAVVAGFRRFLERTGVDWPAPLGAGGEQAPAPASTGTSPRSASGAEVIPTEVGPDGCRLPTGEVRLRLDDAVVRVETPADLDRLRAVAGDEAAARWREAHRRAFGAYFDRGYVACDLVVTDEEHRRCTYVLRRPGP